MISVVSSAGNVSGDSSVDWVSIAKVSSATEGTGSSGAVLIIVFVCDTATSFKISFTSETRSRANFTLSSSFLSSEEIDNRKSSNARSRVNSVSPGFALSAAKVTPAVSPKIRVIAIDFLKVENRDLRELFVMAEGDMLRCTFFHTLSCSSVLRDLTRMFLSCI